MVAIAPSVTQARFDPATLKGPLAHDKAPRDKVLCLQGHTLIADPSGALYWPEERLLVVADMHLEKGSAYATRRVFLPPYDTASTLARLAEVIERFTPRRVVALGDSFHDGGGAARLRAFDVQALRALQTGRDWVWIAGNHDPAGPAAFDGDNAAALAIGRLHFRHEPSNHPGDGEIAGHLHPVAIVGGRGGAVRRRCFLTDATRCVAPAFGAYAGGLNVLDAAFHPLFSDEARVQVLGRSAVYTVGRHQCLADVTSTALW